MSDDKKYLLTPQEDGTYVRVLEDGCKEILTHQQVLEMIYVRDPLIKKAAEKLERLSQDPEVVRQYEDREELLSQQRSRGVRRVTRCERNAHTEG
ncbi:Rpn family recombination-promoting nuclease/putative transposase [Paenibacillus alkaliterrae]|uniref:Rpn family recombination-promoting nuclease/putative transposase n=1 Tax=Paenibacillus alkaliterrae TaxID=320909 RepID=UPI001F2F61F4|nr:Rpn family recombination-promoting nuclease/putative transposase [Paenibacillus alkaliterrae]MCF2940140.1 Rpn family recombination-promoting nuclease/putative transposase [Paenibacillus alkaliterrae]